MNSELEYEAPTWDQIYNMLLNLSERIRKTQFKPDVIVGVARGGWPPARILSDLLGNSNLANIRIEFNMETAETKNQPVLTQPISIPVADKKVLVVDEVADTGETLKLAKEHVIDKCAVETETAVIYYKPWSIIEPDYYEKETDRWIVFPWEIKETIRKISRKCCEENVMLEKGKAKLVKAGVPTKLVNRFLKEMLEEENC